VREFYFTIDRAFHVGLPKEEALSLNQSTLDKARNVRIGEGGLVPYEPIESPNGFNIAHDWPFPQYFRLSDAEILGGRRYVVEMQSGTVIQVTDPQLTVNDEALWSVADFHDYLLAVKGGNCVWERIPSVSTWIPRRPHSSVPYCASVCNFNGQAVVGKLSAWGEWTDVGNSHIAWSDIGSSSFTLSRRNEAGYRRVHFKGQVVEVRKLGKHVIVYGYNGIGILSPVTSPAATFSYDELANFGVFEKGAIGGDSGSHVFLSLDGYLYKIDSGLTLERLGYRNLMEPLMTDYVMISHDSEKDDFYIASEDKSYLLSPQGMTEIYQNPTSLVHDSGRNVGISKDGDGRDFVAFSSPFDMELRGRKTIELLEVGYKSDEQMYAAIDWKMNPNEPWKRTQWVPLNNEGIAYGIRCSGVEFRACLNCDSFDGIEVSYVTARYKMDDMRSIRGVYAPPPKGQRTDS
jgi:hypothetical protein